MALHRARRVPKEEPLERLAPLRCRFEAKDVAQIVSLLQVAQDCRALKDGDYGTVISDIQKDWDSA